MAYNLPPPWDSGYALPGNVRDEGLQRRAFVTKQMPRGTYYQSGVGTGGYAVPQYVIDEGYGQGTTTTKWAPSGSYPGKAIPHWLNEHPQLVADKRLRGGGKQVTIQRGLSGIQSEPPMPDLFEAYGQRAATGLLDRMSRLPPAHRKTALKATLDHVDPSLWKRTAEIARRYNNEGMTAAQSLHQGLARALSTGVAAELIMYGAKANAGKAAIKPRSLLGLAAFGSAALIGLGIGPGGTGLDYRSPPPVKAAPSIFTTEQYQAQALAQAKAQADAAAKYNTGGGLLNLAVDAGTSLVYVMPHISEITVDASADAIKPVIGGGAAKVIKEVAGAVMDTGAVVGSAILNPVKTVNLVVKDAGIAASAIKDASAVVADVVKDGVDLLGDMTCELVNSPTATVVVAGVATAYGVPPAATVAGAGVAKQVCNGSSKPPLPSPLPMPPPKKKGGVLPVAMLAGGAALAFLLLSGKK